MNPTEYLDQLDAIHAAGTADGEWRLQDNGKRHGPENRYEILDDEGSVAVCSDDNDATGTTGGDRTALIVAAVNAQPKLTAALRAVLDLADELEREATVIAVRAGMPPLDFVRLWRDDAPARIRTAITAALGGEL